MKRWLCCGAACAVLVACPMPPAAVADVPGELVTVLSQSSHAGGIVSLAYSPDGRTLVSIGKDGFAKSFDVATGSITNEARVCAYWLHAVTFIDADSVLLSCGDGVVYRWRLATAQPPEQFLASNMSVPHGLFVSPSYPDVFITTDFKDQLTARSIAAPSTPLWQVSTGTIGNVVINESGEIWYSARGFLERRSLSTGEKLSSIPIGGQISQVFSFVSGQEGRAYVSGYVRSALNPNSYTAQVVVVDTSTGSVIGPVPQLDLGAGSRIGRAADGRLFSTGQKGLVMWRPGEAAADKILETPVGSALMTIAPGASRFALVSGNGALVEVDLAQRSARTINFSAPLGVTSLSISRDDSLLAMGVSGGAAQVWSLEDGKLLSMAEGVARGDMYSGVFASSGELIISDASGALRAWDAVRGRVRDIAKASDDPANLWSPAWLPSEECSPKAKIAGCGYVRPAAPRIIGIDDQRIVGSFEATASTPDGGLVAIGGENNLLLLETATGSLRKLHEKVAGVTRPRLLSLSTDGKRLAFHQGGEPRVRVLDLASLTQQDVNLSATPTGVEFLPDSSTSLLVASSDGLVSELVVGNATAIATVGTEDRSPVAALAVSEDGRYVAVAGAGARIHVWNRMDGWKQTVLEGHVSAVLSLKFMRQKPVLVSASRDGSVRFWNPNQGSELAQLRLFTDGQWIVTDRDGYFDGPEEAWERIVYRVSGADNLLRPNRLAQILFLPGLLGDTIARGRTYLSSKTEAPVAAPMARLATLARRKPPRIAIRSEAPDVSGKVVLRVDVTDVGDGMRDLRVYRNGTRIAAVNGALPAAAGSRSFSSSFTIPLASGANRLSAYAFDELGVQSEVDSRDTRYTPVKPRLTRIFTVSVGIDTYLDAAHFNQLRFAGNDAQAFDAQFGKMFANRPDVELPVRRYLIPGAEATRDRILAVLKSLSSCGRPGVAANTEFGGVCPGPDDIVAILFAGHGVRVGERFMLIPRDGRGGNADNLLASSVSDLDLEAVFEDIDSRRTILIVDACNSGAIAADAAVRVGPFNSRGLVQLAYEKGIYILAASQSRNAALEVSSQNHGLLTYALVVDGLGSRSADFSPANGEIVDDEWLRFPLRSVPELQLKFMGERLGRGVQAWIDPAEEGSIPLSSLQVPSFYVPPKRGTVPFTLIPKAQ